MKISIIIFVFSLVILLSGASAINYVFAQEINVTDSGLTPDSSFYFLKTWKESIQTFFIFGAENKAKQFLHLAEVRLAEYQKMIEAGKTEIAQKTLDKYEKQLNQAVEKAQDAQKKNASDLIDAIQGKRVEYQKVFGDILEKTPTETKAGIIDERRDKWMSFIKEVHEKFPKLIPEVVGGETLQAQLFSCPIPTIPLPEDCKDEWFLNQASGCLYFSCPSASKRQAQEPPKQTDLKKSTEKSSVEKESRVCIQVITPAVDPKTNACREFPTPCDVPPGWGATNRCPTVSTSSALSKPPTSLTPSVSSKLPVPLAPTAPVAPAISPTPPTSSVPPKPSISPEPIPTEIRYFTCPDGVKVESGKCYGTGETFYCSILSSPELQCVAPTPPVSKGGVCSTAGETKYYTCSDGAKATWCVCGPESGAVGAKNVWRCQYLPQLACPKPVPAPASQPVACYIQKDCVFVESKDDCLKKGGSPSFESSCPVPTPAPAPLACAVSGIKDYKCPDGTSIKWQCSCGEDSWSCQTNPAIFCPGLRNTTSLIISDIWIRDIFWTEEPPVPNVTQGPGLFHFFWGTNKPATSYVEYGLTDSYGLITPETPTSLGVQHTNNAQTKLKGNTLYHSRIVATDARGNTAVSGDFTFFPAFNFTTIPGTVQPYIRLSSPGISPTHWKIGQTPSIVWEARGVNKVNIDLVMFDSSGNRLKTYSIAKDVSSSGTAGGSYIYTWKALSNSEFLQAGYKFKVVISDPVTFVFGTNANDLFIDE